MSLVLADRRLEDAVPRRAAARLRAFRRQAERMLPDRITQVVLFGSRARGDARPGSDYDVAVFVRDLDNWLTINNILSDAAYEHMLAGYFISPVAVNSDFLDEASPGTLRFSVARDGVVVA